MDQYNLTKNLIDELGLANLPENEKNNLILKLAETLQNRLTLRVFSVLSEAEKLAFDELIKKGNQAEISDFLSSNVQNLEFLIRDEYESFRAELLNQNAAVKSLIDKAKE